ncbi:MAG: hypothetical protein M1549_00245 [Candidatus Dependentiae bacterium]|nr:hypothetical protein [Candidatus Dependentiae bacterium]
MKVHTKQLLLVGLTICCIGRLWGAEESKAVGEIKKQLEDQVFAIGEGKENRLSDVCQYLILTELSKAGKGEAKGLLETLRNVAKNFQSYAIKQLSPDDKKAIKEFIETKKKAAKDIKIPADILYNEILEVFIKNIDEPKDYPAFKKHLERRGGAARKYWAAYEQVQKLKAATEAQLTATLLAAEKAFKEYLDFVGAETVKNQTFQDAFGNEANPQANIAALLKVNHEMMQQYATNPDEATILGWINTATNKKVTLEEIQTYRAGQKGKRTEAGKAKAEAKELVKNLAAALKELVPGGKKLTLEEIEREWKELIKPLKDILTPALCLALVKNTKEMSVKMEKIHTFIRTKLNDKRAAIQAYTMWKVAWDACLDKAKNGHWDEARERIETLGIQSGGLAKIVKNASTAEARKIKLLAKQQIAYTHSDELEAALVKKVKKITTEEAKKDKQGTYQQLIALPEKLATFAKEIVEIAEREKPKNLATLRPYTTAYAKLLLYVLTPLLLLNTQSPLSVTVEFVIPKHKEFPELPVTAPLTKEKMDIQRNEILSELTEELIGACLKPA